MQQNKSNADTFLLIRESYACAPQSQTNKRFCLQALRGIYRKAVCSKLPRKWESGRWQTYRAFVQSALSVRQVLTKHIIL